MRVEKADEVVFWEFRIEPAEVEYVTDIKKPRRTFADATISLVAKTKMCSNRNNESSDDTFTIAKNSGKRRGEKKRAKKVKAATVNQLLIVFYFIIFPDESMNPSELVPCCYVL